MVNANRLEPLSRCFGWDRGTPIDRYYIEKFLKENQASIRGAVLEFGDDRYTRQFWDIDITSSAILNSNGRLTHDIEFPERFERDQYDCVICTQVLYAVFNFASALETLNKILRPKGTLLLTTTVISQAIRDGGEEWGDYWRFTAAALQRLCFIVFPDAEIKVTRYGNLTAAVNFLTGRTVEEMHSELLEETDPDYELLVAARVTKR